MLVMIALLQKSRRNRTASCLTRSRPQHQRRSARCDQSQRRPTEPALVVASMTWPLTISVLAGGHFVAQCQGAAQTLAIAFSSQVPCSYLYESSHSTRVHSLFEIFSVVLYCMDWTCTCTCFTFKCIHNMLFRSSAKPSSASASARARSPPPAASRDRERSRRENPTRRSSRSRSRSRSRGRERQREKDGERDRDRDRERRGARHSSFVPSFGPKALWFQDIMTE